MARIRSIKPEFFTSEQVMNLTAPARVAFIGLWVFSDDGGNHPASAKTLKAEVFPSDDITSADVQALVDEMLAQRLVACYEVAGKQYWHVTGWHHQRIDKPTFKHPKFEEQSPPTPGPSADHSGDALGPLGEDSASPPGGLDPGVERSGEETIGEDVDTFRLGADAPPPAPLPPGPPKPAKQKTAQQEKPKTGDVWQAYKAAYAQRYGIDPVSNAKVNGMLANLLKRVPAEEAPAIARFYVASEERFYVSARHSVDLLLRDAEKLRTDTLTGGGTAPSRTTGFAHRDYTEGFPT